MSTAGQRRSTKKGRLHHRAGQGRLIGKPGQPEHRRSVQDRQRIRTLILFLSLDQPGRVLLQPFFKDEQVTICLRIVGRIEWCYSIW